MACDKKKFLANPLSNRLLIIIVTKFGYLALSVEPNNYL